MPEQLGLAHGCSSSHPSPGFQPVQASEIRTGGSPARSRGREHGLRVSKAGLHLSSPFSPCRTLESLSPLSHKEGTVPTLLEETGEAHRGMRFAQDHTARC